MIPDGFHDNWQIRYGSEPKAAQQIADVFLNHRSIRHFTDEPIEEGTVSQLVAAAQSASTSSNLQLWTLVSVQSPEKRTQMAELCANQSQINECAWFLAFLADTHRIHETATKMGQDPNGLDYEEFYLMSVIDASLAAERMVCAAESMGLGACYIGALRNNARGVKEALDLPQGTLGLFGLCLGWPIEPLVEHVKPRLSQAAIWHRESYNHDVSAEIADYDERMRAHFRERGANADITWSQRSAKRVDGSEKSLSGRGQLHDWVREQGFARR